MTPDALLAGLVTALFGQTVVILLVGHAYLRERWRRLDTEAGITAVRAAGNRMKTEVERQERRLIPSRN